MNPFAHFKSVLDGALHKLIADDAFPADADTSRIVVEPPRDPAHGDITTNAAMILAKPAGKPPRDIAQLLCDALAAHDDVESAEIAGPGFVNMRISAGFWPGFVRATLAAGEAFGNSEVGTGQKINVEYVSANPTGPLQVGHCRGAVFGDALANLLEATGHDVVREYYTNDAGSQITVLAESVLLRYREALGEEIGEIPSGLYPGDYLVPVGKALADEYGQKLLEMDEAARLELIKERAIAAMMDLIREDLGALNIHQEVFFSEKTLHESGRIEETVSDMREKGLVFEGRIPPPKGQLPEDWEDREQTLFRATDFGDDIDRPLAKSDGSFTYFAADVAYARDKIERGFDELVFVLGADHGGYVKRLQAVTKALSGGSVSASVLLVPAGQTVPGRRAVQNVKAGRGFCNLARCG